MPDTAHDLLGRGHGPVGRDVDCRRRGVVGGGHSHRAEDQLILQVGSPGMVPMWWVLGEASFTQAGALTYAELAAMMPEARGEPVYLKAAYGALTAVSVYG